MSIWDTVKKFAQPYADDEYDDYDDDEEYLDDEYEEPAPRRAPGRRAAPAPVDMEDEEDYILTKDDEKIPYDDETQE